jgi:hypothetical protein
LDKYRLELEDIRDLIESIKNLKALKAAIVSEPLTNLKKLEGKLCDWLAKVEPGNKKSLRQFSDQLIHGQDDRKKLDHIMKDLDRAKNNLLIALSMHQTTATLNIRDVVNTENTKPIRVSQKAKKHRNVITRQKIMASRRAKTNSKDINHVGEA